MILSFLVSENGCIDLDLPNMAYKKIRRVLAGSWHGTQDGEIERESDIVLFVFSRKNTQSVIHVGVPVLPPHGFDVVLICHLQVRERVTGNFEYQVTCPAFRKGRATARSSGLNLKRRLDTKKPTPVLKLVLPTLEEQIGYARAFDELQNELVQFLRKDHALSLIIS